MPNDTLNLTLTLVPGQGSYGKTTFCYRYLLNSRGVACRFIFDDQGQAARRLNLPWCGTEAGCEAALQTGWVCFNPNRMFPGVKLFDGFRWFCQWALAVSKRGPGRKIFFVDELWQWVDSRNAPPDELENVIRLGRTEGLELISATHSPQEFHRNIRRLVTEWVCFNLVEKGDLDAIRPYFAGVDQVKTLERFEFLSYHRETSAVLRAKLP